MLPAINWPSFQNVYNKMRKEIGRALPFVNVCHSQGSYIIYQKSCLIPRKADQK